jgi:hypothetical protein
MAENAIGIIYLTAEVEQEFGIVQSLIEISSEELKSFLNQTNKYLMFKIINGILYILGDNRSVLFPSEGYINPEEVFAVYSKSKVYELIDTGGEKINAVENRNGIFSVTNGLYTLEASGWCPPLCS